MNKDDSDDDLIFAEEVEDPEQPTEEGPPWKLLIVDDEREVHRITRMILSGFTFENRKLEMISAYSGSEAARILEQQLDIAVVLLDVVMETDHAGLDLISYIRTELQNHNLRIILRTGQPGIAPEHRVIVEYDINDYKDKTELTEQKLFTSILSSLRGYRDLTNLEHQRRVIEYHRHGLEKIIAASDSIFELRSLQQYAEGVLMQLQALLGLDIQTLYAKSSGFSAVQGRRRDDFRVMAATGAYSGIDHQHHVRELVPEDAWTVVKQAIEQQKTIYEDDHLVCYIEDKGGNRNILYLQGEDLKLSQSDMNLVAVFNKNISIAFDNIRLNQEIEDTQKEVIARLGEVLEYRSEETGHHAKRVGEYCWVMAQKYGLPEEQLDLIKTAAPLHDVGKVAIPDAILNKPGPLLDDEYTIMQTHATLGYRMLAGSERPLLQTASRIAQQHHEKVNGTGYPQGLVGEEIAIEARIAAIADVFDALTSDRIYRKAWDLDKIVDLFKRERGEAFDAQLIDLFLENLNVFLEIRKKLA